MAAIEEQTGAPPAVLARGALTLFDTVSSTLANLAPVEGIFLAITLVVFAMGSMAPWAFLIAGVAILATGNTMSEFSRSIPSAGSFVTFIGRGFGAKLPRTGSVLSGLTYYLLVICYPVTLGAVVVFMGSWVASLFNWGNAGWLLITLGAVALAVPLLLRGVVISARASFIMFCSEALGLIILSVVVLARAHGHLGAPFHALGGSPGGMRGLVGLTFALAVSGFVGWENSGALAEESKNPRRYIPVTVFSSIVIITALYVLSSWAAVAGTAVLVYGVYEFVQPSQPPPANVFWAWILGIAAIAAIATAVVYVRRPDALQRAGTIGPEFVMDDA